MPRRSFGGGRFAPARSSMRSAPKPARQAPPPDCPTRGGGSILGEIRSNFAQGLGAGIGIEVGDRVGYRVVDAVMDSYKVQHENVIEAPAMSSDGGGAGACNLHSKAFQDCIDNNASDISKCQFYFDKLTDCGRDVVEVFEEIF